MMVACPQDLKADQDNEGTTMPTIDEVRELVWCGHKPPLGEEAPEQTLNRLWKKHWGLRKRKFGKEFVSGPPEALTAENTSIVSEQWSSDDLGSLLDGDCWLPIRGDKNAAVVIIRHQDRNSLFDGRKRITRWRKQKPPTNHEAWIVEVIT